MFSSYKPEDVILLLKDISGLVTPLPTKEREALIQSGVHYSEMLPLEYEPSEAYLKTYEKALGLYAKMTAEAVAHAADWIWREKGKEGVLVSLARAGTPIGILMKRYIEKTYHVPVAHYTISIIRGKGIDKNAMDYLLKRHDPQKIQFVDGWTGKGAIQSQLNAAMKDYPDVDSGLAVLSDPAHVATKYGTYDDFLIASSCLNATVSGLISRTFLRKDIIGEGDFHGAAFYKELKDRDLTYQFIDTVEQYFPCNRIDFGTIVLGKEETDFHASADGRGLKEVYEIAREFHIDDINLIKPSIGEATRVLLRRVPWKMLVHSLDDPKHLGHLYQLAKEKGVEVIEYPLKNYRACGIIRSMGDQ